jgi:uncharacterized protein (TIGR04222 family)
MLTHNPLAEMYGPHFLLLYFAVITLTLIVCGWAVSRLDTTDERRLPLVPTQPDTLEIAHLRGGENEVLRVAIFDLLQRGLLQVKEEAKGGRLKVTVKRIVRTDPLPEMTRFLPIERRILDYFATPHTAGEIFQSGAASGMKGLCSGYERALREENLLFGDDRQAQAVRLGWNAAAVITALGAYKLYSALANGHNNVGFLVVMGLIGLCIVPFVCSRRRLTRRGKAYIARLQQAFDQFKRQTLDRQTVAVLAGHSKTSEAETPVGFSRGRSRGAVVVRALLRDRTA